MRLPSWFRGFRSTRERRLEAEIPSFELHINSVTQARPGEWSQSAKAAVAEARVALDQHRLGEALIAFDRAQREEIPSLTEEEVCLRAVSLIHQAERLNDLTRDTIKEILQNKTHSITATELAAATKIRDDDLQNTLFAMERLNRHLNRLCFITSAVLMGVVALAKYHVVLPNITILLGVMCFGALGAAVSMMMYVAPLAGGPVSQLFSGSLLFARPLFGASAAVAVYVFIEMGVLGGPYQNNFKYFGIAFIAGFSDQLLLSAVSKVASSSSGSAKGRNHKQ
jgi:hypothetical protein